MRRIGSVLKRCAAAVMIAVMLGVSMGVTFLDAHALAAEPHFDAPQHPACSPYDHNHSLCAFLAASPVLAAASAIPALAPAPELVLRPHETRSVFASGVTIHARSRSPPAV